MASKPEIAESLKASVEGSKTEYVRLGNSGLRVSMPILGAMSIGHPDWAPWVLDEEKVQLLLPSQFPGANEDNYSHCLFSSMPMNAD